RQIGVNGCQFKQKKQKIIRHKRKSNYITTIMAAEGSFKNKFYFTIMPKIYGVGASVVILGAMFKILDWTGANLMIGVGLTTEAIIFFLSAFEPRNQEVDWSRVYPELSDDSL